jgi:aerobic carbon-monoxide dehydrogenase large subunit
MPKVTVADRSKFVAGQGKFLADIQVDDALEVAFVRTSEPFSWIKSLQMPDGCGFTGRDLAKELRPLRVEGNNLFPCDWYPLATDRTRYVGEPIAMVWAETRHCAEDLADEVMVAYEQIPKMTPLHDEVPDGIYFDYDFARGDVDAAFERADHIFERTFSNARASAMPMETRGVIANWDGERLTVWTSTQIPDIVRDALSESLGLDAKVIRVIVPDVGGGFGQKAHVFSEEIAVALAAKKLGRTLRWVEDRRESLIAGGHAHDTQVALRVAVTKDGRLLAVDYNVLNDAGAYSVYPHSPIAEAVTCAYAMFAPYSMDDLRMSVKAIASNRCPAGVHRGVGSLAAVHATERMMDEIAEKLGMDPLEIRRRNVLTSLPALNATGGRVGSGNYFGLIDRLVEAADYPALLEAQRKARAEGRMLGIGIGLFNEGSGICATDYERRAITTIPGYDATRLIVKSDGRIEIRTSAAEAGQHHATAYREIAFRLAGLEADQIDVIEGDTDLCPRGTGTFASRGAVGVFESVARAIKAAMDVNFAPGTDITRTVAQQREIGQAITLAVVEIDPISLIPHVERMVFVHDCGVVMRHELVDGQVQGGVANGIGCVLLEELIYDESNQIITGTMMDYKMALATDVPLVEIFHQETPSKDNILGTKGCGEVGTIAPHGAVANAVINALAPTGKGNLLASLPYTPQSIFDVLNT